VIAVGATLTGSAGTSITGSGSLLLEPQAVNAEVATITAIASAFLLNFIITPVELIAILIRDLIVYIKRDIILG
jgi:hypothetical protein